MLIVKETKGPYLFLKTILFTFIFLFTFFLITLVAGALYGFSQFKIFTNTANITTNQFKKTLQQGWQTSLISENGKVNFLLLGVDSLKTRGNSLPLTDTMMLISLDTKSGKITTLPLPRDLYSDQYQTKINALYVYGLEKNPQNPEKFSQQVISEMTNLKIHHTLVLSMDQVSEIINLLSGIEVDVEKGFVDNEFPNPNVDVTKEKDPAKLYMSVEFKPGKEVMNGQRALQYIRSRHSEDLQAGTDDARSKRQQQVINSLISKLKQQDVIFNPTTLGLLYRYYLDNFDQYFPMTQIVSLAKTSYQVRNNIEFISQHLTIFPDDLQGIIYHPPTKQTKNLWVYSIKDPAKFPEQIKSLLNQ